MIIKFVIFFITIITCLAIGNGETQKNEREDVTEELQLDFETTKLSFLNLAIDIFEKPSIKNKLHDLFNIYLTNNPLFDNVEDLEESWRIYIFDYIHNSTDIVTQSKNDVSLLSQSLIQELIEYLQRIFINLNNDQKFFYPSSLDYVKKIEWKKNGKIDEINTYLNIFNERGPNLNEVNKKYLFLEACKYCLEININILWNELSIVTQEHIVNNILYGKHYDMAYTVLSKHEIETRHLLFYWRWKFETFGSKVLRLNEKFINDDFELKSIISYTIPKSIETTNVVAVQYLIDKYLKNKKLTQNIIKNEVIIWLSKRKEKQSIYYDDMLLFLLRKIEKPAIYDLFNEYKLEILDTMIESWPGKYLFLRIIRASGQITFELFKSLFAHILQTISKEYNLFEKKSLTSFWLLSKFLIYSSGLILYGNEAISVCWSLPVLTKQTKLITIAFISSNRIIDQPSNLTAINKEFKKFGRLFLTNKKYDVLSDHINYMLSDENKNEFIDTLDVNGYYKNLLEYTDDEEISKIFNFYDFLNATHQETRIMDFENNVLVSNENLKNKHDTAISKYTKMHS